MIKRGVSAVIANVLIVLLVVAGVAIMWGFIYPVLKDTGSEIDITQFSLFLEILPNSVYYNTTSEEINFTVYRKAGSGELAGIVILLEDLGGTQARLENIGEKYALEELESVIFNYDYTAVGGVNLDGIRKISVAPIIVKSDGDEEVSGVTDVVLLGDNGVSSYVCGDEDDFCDEGSTEVCEVGDGYAGNNTCSADCSAWGICVPTEWCGDTLLNGDEICETNILNEETCTSQTGYQFGDLACGTNCLSYDVSDCSNSHPIFGDPLVEDEDSSSDDTFLRTWPFDDVSELEIPLEAECTPGCGGDTTDHECYDPYYLDDRPHWYLIGNSDSGGSNPFIDTAPDGTTIAAQLNNLLGPDTHSRVVVAMSRPNPNIYYVGFTFYIESDSFNIPILNSHQIFSMRSVSDPSGCSGPSNQQTNKVTVSYSHVKDYIDSDNWERLVIKHTISTGLVEVLFEGEVIESYSNFSPGQESHQFQLRSRDNDSRGAIWFNNLAVGTDYDEVLNYQG